MNTRRKGSLTSSFLKEEDHVKRNSAASTENFQEQTAELGQGPVFNIHIHMPANKDTNESKMYLPRIQPIIHVHFDELADKLKNNASQKEGGLSEIYVQTLVKQVTPKFGKILFHHKHKSFTGCSNSYEKNSLKPNQAFKGKNSRIELESSITDIGQKQNSENSNRSTGNGPNKRTQGVKSDNLSNVVYNGHPIKLKKAIVVLEDILQPSFYKSGRIRNLLGEISLSQYSPSCLSNGATNLGSQIKTEPASSSPRSPTAYENKKPYASGNSCMSFNSTNSFDSDSFEFSKAEGSLKRESLASLVEGCNFSEILKKFRDKYKTYAEEPYQSCDGDNKQEEEEDGKGWVNLQDGVNSHEIKNQLQNSYERNTEINEWSNSVDPSIEKSRNGVYQMLGDLGVESSINPFHVAEVESDAYEITTRNKLSSDVVEDLKPIEFDVCNPTSDIVIKSEFSLVETNDFMGILADAKDQYFDLTSMNWEMVSHKEVTNKTMNNENRNSRNGGKGFSPKTFKQSSETAKESTTKTPRSVDYIPLNISGPTEFAVVPLSNVQGYKTHDAKDFKKDMLFGKRVNRFINPEHLRMYKLKKQQKYCQNKKTLKK